MFWMNVSLSPTWASDSHLILMKRFEGCNEELHLFSRVSNFQKMWGKKKQFPSVR